MQMNNAWNSVCFKIRFINMQELICHFPENTAKLAPSIYNEMKESARSKGEDENLSHDI